MDCDTFARAYGPYQKVAALGLSESDTDSTMAIQQLVPARDERLAMLIERKFLRRVERVLLSDLASVQYTQRETGEIDAADDYLAGFPSSCRASLLQKTQVIVSYAQRCCRALQRLHAAAALGDSSASQLIERRVQQVFRQVLAGLVGVAETLSHDIEGATEKFFDLPVVERQQLLQGHGGSNFFSKRQNEHEWWWVSAGVDVEAPMCRRALALLPESRGLHAHLLAEVGGEEVEGYNFV
ncbi:unnamed protein product, partial [Amoebophrya sp. A120]|eukprot:GSA120T00017556001.1